MAKQTQGLVILQRVHNSNNFEALNYAPIPQKTIRDACVQFVPAGNNNTEDLDRYKYWDDHEILKRETFYGPRVLLDGEMADYTDITKLVSLYLRDRSLQVGETSWHGEDRLVRAMKLVIGSSWVVTAAAEFIDEPSLSILEAKLMVQVSKNGDPAKISRMIFDAIPQARHAEFLHSLTQKSAEFKKEVLEDFIRVGAPGNEVVGFIAMKPDGGRGYFFKPAIEEDAVPVENVASLDQLLTSMFSTSSKPGSRIHLKAG